MKKSEEQSDIEKTLSKIPKSHRGLLRGYDFKLHSGNTLNGDDDHIGYMDAEEEEIAVAAPWNYGREFATLHEIAHVVWEHLGKDIKREWQKLVNKTKKKHNQKPHVQSDSLDQSAEEIFCMCYANYYTKHKLATYSHPEWLKFIENLPK